MKTVRRAVIAVSETLGVLLLLGATLLGGSVSASLQQAADASAHGDPTWAFVAGAAIGFIPAALFLALLFALFEIAANTRETNILMRRIAGGSS